jgi:CxxC motif-containing protein
MISEIKNNLPDKGRDNFSVTDMQQKISNCSVPKEVIQQIFQFLMAGSHIDNLTCRLNIFLVCKKWKHWASEIDSIEFLRKQFLGEKAKVHPDLLFASRDTPLFKSDWIHSKIIYKNLQGGASLHNLLKSEALIIHKDDGSNTTKNDNTVSQQLVKLAKELMERLPFSYSSIIETENSSEGFKDVIKEMKNIKTEIDKLDMEPPTIKTIINIIDLIVLFFEKYPKIILQDTEISKIEKFLDILSKVYSEIDRSSELYDKTVFIYLLMLNRSHSLDRIFVFLTHVLDFIKARGSLTNRKHALQAMIYNEIFIPDIPFDLKNDHEFFLEAIEYRVFIGKSCDDLYRNLVEHVKKNIEFWRKAIVLDYKALAFTPDDLFYDPDFMNQAIKNNSLTIIYFARKSFLDRKSLSPKDVKENFKKQVEKELEKNKFTQEWEKEYFDPKEKKFYVKSLYYYWKIVESIWEEAINNPDNLQYSEETLLLKSCKINDVQFKLSEEINYYLKNGIPILKSCKINDVQFKLSEEINYYLKDETSNFHFFMRVCSELGSVFENVKYFEFLDAPPLKASNDYDKENFVDKIKNYKLKNNTEMCTLTFKILEESDKELLLKTITKYGEWIEYASEELKNDKEFVIEAVKNNGKALRYISEKLKNDEDVVIEAVKNSGKSLEFASEDLQNDIKIVITAVNNNGSALQYASKKLQNDKDVVMTAVKNNGLALNFASNDLKDDEEIVRVSVNYNAESFLYASKRFKNHREIVIAAVKNCRYALGFASENLRNDKEIVLCAVKHFGPAFEYASEELRNNEKVVIEAINIKGASFQYATENLRNNKTVVLAAVKKKGSNLQFTSLKLCDDLDVIMQAIHQGGKDVLQFASKERAKEIEEANA